MSLSSAHFMRLCMAAVLLILGHLAGCTTPVPPNGNTRTYDIQIQHALRPHRAFVYVGDEVRWHNLQDHAVTIALLSPLASDSVSCNSGFTRFGALDDTATIPPHGSVSLCFRRAGTISYNVWLNPNDPLRSMTPTATISVSARPANRS